MELLAEAGQAKNVTTIGVPDRFLPFGSPADVLASVGMDPESVVRRVLAVLGR